MSALSYAQERLWFLDRLTPGDGTYNMVVCERLIGPLDPGALARALSEIVARHESLRTVFPEAGGAPAAVVLDPAPVEIERLDLTGGDGGHPSGTAGERLRELLAERSNRPFDLAEGPLFRAALLRTGPGEHVFLLVVHHIAGDAWSIEQVLFAELAALYAAFTAGLPSPLPPPALQYRDYARLQRERPAELDGLLRELDGVPVLELPADRPRPAVRTTGGDLSVHRIPVELWQEVTALARAERCTPFMTVLAAYQVLLSRYTGQEDFCVGTPVAGRDHEEYESVFGIFINTLALRADLAGDPTFRETLKRVRRRAFTMYGHAAVPFERVVGELRLDRDPARTPLFQTMLMLGNPDGGTLTLDGLRTEPVLSGLTGAKFDLALDVVVYPTHVQLMFTYSTDLFDRSTVERMAAHFETLLRSIVADPGRRLSELEILPAGELAAVLGEPPEELAWETGALLLDHLIARQAARTPHAPAVIVPGTAGASATSDAPARPAAPGTAGGPGGTVLTYGGLDRAATAVADRLRLLLARTAPSGPAGQGARVALALTAGPEAVVALLGILKAGAAYVPLDPAQPAERLAYLLADSGAAVVIAEEAGFAGFTGPIVTRADLAFWTTERAAVPEPAVRHPDQAAYVIYTSGSTGRPKGVVVGHRTLSHLARSFRDLHGFGPGERVLMVPPLSFDASAGDVFPALISGAALVLHPDPASLTGPALVDLCAEHSITMVDTASALWQQWVEHLEEAGDGGARAGGAGFPLTTMMVGGEGVPLERLRAWAGLTGGRVAFHNHYGPTEATVCATAYRTVDGSELGAATHLPIGTALPHTRVYVLDRHGNPAPIGVPGEVHIGGECLAHGYLGRPGLTAGRFLPDPFSPRPGARMYATGDLARVRSGGNLEFLGRTDRQVKVNGNRIEPGEVEAACLAHPGVREAVVVAGARRLVAYLVGEPLTTAALRAFLADRLPGYMIPGAVVMLAALPLTSHGKIDFRALPEPDRDGDAPPYEPPREGTERALAAVWAEVLKVEPGRRDNFFDLGGHSLLAPRIVSGIAAGLGVTVPMTALFATADLAELAAVVDGRPDEAVDLRAEAVLPGDIARTGAPVPDGPPERVLLTGASGFLGAYLLAGLLRATEAEIHCLVRGDDPVGRLRGNLERHGLWEDRFAGRIVPERGDLGAPGLGLPPGRSAELADSADLIVHNGALVNFALPYRRLRAANVDGVLEILRLAARGRITTPVHLVSTLGVHLTPGERTVREGDPLPDPDLLHLGYDQSKWVADRLAGAARRTGLPIAIHRPARVSADSRTGRSAPGDFLGRLFATCALLGSVPDGERLDMAPVDHVAAAIVHLARSRATGDFHYYNPRVLNSAELAEGLRERGFPVRLVPGGRWRRLVRDRLAVGDDLPIALYPAFVADHEGPGGPSFDCSATEETLAGAGLVCPPADGALLGRYLDHYIGAGVLAGARRA
ncbi:MULTISPECIES: non-ribosomal peptide synthetase [Streptosporangium]|uniref:Amino acid adenylation domain-containing protein/thioester reductase-like protein n=1 Tax=Streptosporangium brasiliense TaxID=47480 RepID=A0ABT9QWA1_9ACTN|nr:amino acid adenylation domain-containing protein [Streptosporangium brasiliense]MDP9861264.1 amino acid adenylation domain-containing protein/thioester reductase-like protein [Streptosporangium brasiliense]